MGLLDDYKKMVEEDEKNLNNDAPVDGIEMTDEEMKMYEKKLNEMREEIKNNDCMDDGKNDCDAEIKPLTKYKEEDLKTEYVKVTPMVKRAYCPECGKEIVNRGPVMYNPFTFEKTCPHKCECGWKGDLEYAYPRVVFVTENGTQIEAYAK
jgi:hypothetical protein